MDADIVTKTCLIGERIVIGYLDDYIIALLLLAVCSTCVGMWMRVPKHQEAPMSRTKDIEVMLYFGSYK